MATLSDNMYGRANSSKIVAMEHSFGCMQKREDRKEKTIIAPPIFIFQKTGPSMKRRADRLEQESVIGASLSKRIRSFTYPSPRAQNESCDSNRRIRSTSLSCSPPLPASKSSLSTPSSISSKSKTATDAVPPVSRVKRLFLRPALLLAPRTWNISMQPHLPEASYQCGNADICRPTSCQPSCSVVSKTTHRPKVEGSAPEKRPFVFGENMSERVLSPLKKNNDTCESDCSSSDSESSSSESGCTVSVRGTLSESAAAYSASCRRHNLFRCVQRFTGEEKESNVLQLTCGLFVLESGTQSWSERGRGVLRLNDLATGNKGCMQSRIVMRHQGSLKVILNTRLWSHTHLRRPTRRNLQVTATDLESGAMRVFLIQAGVRDVARLYVAIHHRLVALRCGSVGQETNGKGGGARDDLCNSENEEEEEDEEEDEERQRQQRVGKLYLTRLRPVVCDWIHNKASLESR